MEAPILVLDTAISTAVVALGTAAGELLATDAWQAGYRHGEELLARIDALLRGAGVRLEEVAGVVVGTGPGAFTGMRVGLATAKALARGLRVPIVGVPSAAALLAAVTDSRAPAGSPAPGGPRPVATPPVAPLALMLPAGPSDRMLVLEGRTRLLPGGEEPELPDGTAIVAVDLAGRAPDEALALGQVAAGGLAAALLRIGAGRLAAGDTDDVAKLVPEYVTLPRGVRSAAGEMRWSRERT